MANGKRHGSPLRLNSPYTLVLFVMAFAVLLFWQDLRGSTRSSELETKPGVSGRMLSEDDIRRVIREELKSAAAAQRLHSSAVAPGLHSQSPPVAGGGSGLSFGDIDAGEVVSASGELLVFETAGMKSQKFTQLKSYRIGVPGVEGKEIQFPAGKESWMASRHFPGSIFFCPKNGFEGSITNLYSVIMSVGDAQNSIVLDVGSNLGFYSIEPALYGYKTFAFDLQQDCLRSVELLSEANHVSDLVTLYNFGLANSVQVALNSNSGCDYENFFETKEGAAAIMSSPSKKVIMPLDLAASLLKGGDVIANSRTVQLIKIDTEGAEVPIIQGAAKLLGSGLVKNLVIEVTPAHWNRFGLDIDSVSGREAFHELQEKYGYQAYLIWIPDFRAPPARMYSGADPIFEDVLQHPLTPSVTGSGCEGRGHTSAPFLKILSMRKFMKEYCLVRQGHSHNPHVFLLTTPTCFFFTPSRTQEHLATVTCSGAPGKVCTGFCGNLWFHKA